MYGFKIRPNKVFLPRENNHGIKILRSTFQVSTWKHPLKHNKIQI